MPRPIVASINLAAIRHNLAVTRQRAKGRHIWAVVKANAYGHGLERVLPALSDADGLALLDLDEARRARAAGWSRPILLLEGFFESQDLFDVDRLRLTVMLHSEEQVQMLHAWNGATVPINALLKIDTGMSRLGISPDRTQIILDQLQRLSHVNVTALATHFANADQHHNISVLEVGADLRTDVATQLSRFAQARRHWTGNTCLANSAAVFLRPDVGGDAVRPGIALYGGSPGAMSAAQLELLPAMTLSARLIAVRDVAEGQGVGYGTVWRAPHATRIGVVACGYADGYPRLAPNGTPVDVEGTRVKLVGRVSMDMLTVDLADTAAEVGADVQLWGARLPIDEVARACGTIGYELMCALAARVPVVVQH